MKLKLKIKLGFTPERLMVFERQGDLFEYKGIRLFLCQPNATSTQWRVFCAKTGLGFGNPHKTKGEALISAAAKFEAYDGDLLRRLIDEGCKDGGYINENILKDIKKVDTTAESLEENLEIDKKPKIY